MMHLPLRKISSFFFRRPSRLVREININAALIQWCAKYLTNNIFTRRFELYEFVNSSLSTKPIDYLEFGVYKGASILKWAEINKHPDSRFYGFDTFEGLPESWDNVRLTHPQGTFDIHGNVPKSNDGRVKFVKGLFQDTLRPFLETFTTKNNLIVHNDSDLYSSTLYCLSQMDSILRKGSVLIFDEFFCAPHEFQAFIDYARAYRRKYRVLGAVGRKPYEQIALVFE